MLTIYNSHWKTDTGWLTTGTPWLTILNHLFLPRVEISLHPIAQALAQSPLTGRQAIKAWWLWHICEHLSLFCAFPLKQPGLFFRLNWMLRSIFIPQGKFPGGGRTGKVPSAREGGGILSELALIFLPGRKPQDESSCHFAFDYIKEQSAIFVWIGGYFLHWAPSFLSHPYFFFKPGKHHVLPLARGWPFSKYYCERNCSQCLQLPWVFPRKILQPPLGFSFSSFLVRTRYIHSHSLMFICSLPPLLGIML